MAKSSTIYQNQSLEPKYEHMHPWEVYAFDLMIEYEQCKDAGLEIKNYRRKYGT